jgi:hypothetical protein
MGRRIFDDKMIDSHLGMSQLGKVTPVNDVCRTAKPFPAQQIILL